MADDKNKCKNPSCTCPAQPGGKYCSASCEGTGDTIELDCDCGHEECGGNFLDLFTQRNETCGELWSSSFIFVLEEHERSFPVLSSHTFDPLPELRV